MKIVNQDQFGKDHWSLLGYVESRVHDYQVAPATGELNKDHLRINPKGDYGILATPFRGSLVDRQWKKAYGTRLRGYFNGKIIDETKLIPDHDC